MIWGLSTSTFTLVHVVLSLVGIFAGLVAMFGLVAGKRLDGWTVVFLATTAATSVTGFAFPFDHLLPSHKVGIVSLLVLPVAIAARYAFHLAGAWRRVYVIGAAVALYLNLFVLVVQTLPQGAGPQGDRPDAKGVAVRDRAARRPGALRVPRRARGDPVSRRAPDERLTGRDVTVERKSTSSVEADSQVRPAAKVGRIPLHLH